MVNVIEQLVEFIGHSNDAAEDDDRGRAEDAIMLLLFDDGSGRVMIRDANADFAEMGDGQPLFNFDSLSELRLRVEEL